MKRHLHPLAWWAWSLLLAGTAAMTTNPWTLLWIIGVLLIVTLNRRSSAPWALAFRVYVYLAITLFFLRIAWRLIFSSGGGATILIPLEGWQFGGLTVLGSITLDNILFGVYDGLRLATIVLCIGAANTLANPKRLLRSLPKGLQEIGTALTVALSVFPQLAEATVRITRARRYRTPEKATLSTLFNQVAVPVMMDALDGSLNLAASMSVRGYDSRPRVRSVQYLLIISAAMSIAALYFLLSTDTWLVGFSLLAGTAAITSMALVIAGQQVKVTKYKPDPWHWQESVVAVCAVPALAMSLAFPSLAFPGTWPSFDLGLLLAIAVALSALVAPTGPRA